MKLSLQLKLGQQLTMTPQLQQAIKLLQLSTLDLQQEIHEAIESNPMLEFTEESAEEGPPPAARVARIAGASVSAGHRRGPTKAGRRDAVLRGLWGRGSTKG